MIIRDADEKSGIVPATLLASPPIGIIMVGLFNSAYYQKIIELGYPLVTYDTAPEIAMQEKQCDVVLMDDKNSSYSITRRMIENGHTNIVFAGDKNSCWSFYRRWEGYRKAMLDSGLEIPSQFQFDYPADNRHFSVDGFYEKLKDAAERPTAFVCANDAIAQAVDRLQRPPYCIYDSIAIGGFDNYDYAITSSEFSTVEVYLQEIGRTLGEQILWRINNPQRKYRFIEIESTPIYRKK